MVVDASRPNNELGWLDTASSDAFERAPKAVFSGHVSGARMFEDRPTLSWQSGTSKRVFPSAARKLPDAAIRQHQSTAGRGIEGSNPNDGDLVALRE